MMKPVMIVLALVLTGGLSATAAQARFEFSPYLTLQEEYNDNVNLSADDEEEDWITTISPGIRLNYSARSVTANIDYSLRYRFYKNNSDNNQDKFKDVQRANASLFFFQGRPFTLSLSETISREALDERDPFSPDNERVNSSNVYRTRVSPQYRHQLSPTLSAVVAYVYSRVDYSASVGEETQAHTGRLSLIKAINSNLDVSANYSYSWHLTEFSDQDYDTQDYTLGIDYRVSSRTQLSLSGGYSRIDFEDGRDSDTMTFGADFSYRITAPLTFSLNYSQSYATSATEGVTESRQASARLAYVRERLTASSELFWRNSDFLESSRQDDIYGVRLALGYQLMRNIRSSFDAEYQIADYDPGNETVNTLSLGTALHYNYRRFTTSLGYRFRDRNADDSASDYTNNIVTLTLSARF